jgi:hypothetical protein
LSLSSENLVSKFAFKFNLYRYTAGLRRKHDEAERKYSKSKGEFDAQLAESVDKVRRQVKVGLYFS